ncbi:MAG: carboxymuconolactone decarboxylase family protein [Desulfovibrionaceae bacterium]|nr:carboxymuconolactone decarboxylase family protein [Desulfovibrionaceae bacterium]
MLRKLTSAAGCLLVLASLVLTDARADSSPLDARQQSIVAIAAFTACGDLDRLKPALVRGLESGLTVSEIKEVLVQLYAYTGFPRSLNGISTFMAVMKEREEKGIRDEAGREPSPVPDGFDRDSYGARTRATLGGRTDIPAPSGYQLFAPQIDDYLKQHLFADIFQRDNLTWKDRELATISALAAMTGTASQQRFHQNAAMNMGLTEEQMKQFADIITAEIGADAGSVSRKVLSAVLESRKK